MCSILVFLTVKNNYTINNMLIFKENSKGFIHPSIVVLRNETLYGAQSYLNQPKDVINVVSSWLYTCVHRMNTSGILLGRQIL